jgi:hypothetical protein
MVKRLVLASVSAAMCVSTTALAQTQAPAPKPAARAYAPPKTLWGDPDIQGNYTNKYEQGTPFERPADLDGKTLADISKAELAEIIKKRQQRAIDNAPFLSGDPTGTIAGPMEFRDIYEVGKASRPWFVTDPPDGKIPPMLPDAQKRIAALPRGGSSFSNGVYDNYDSLGLYDRCITRGYPNSMLPAIYGDSYQIIQSPGFVAIRIEMIHETRIIPLGGQPHASKGLALDMGDARGHWEGNTLVVETTNFTTRSAYRGANAERLKLTERFTRVAPDKISWTMTVEDPTTWTRPWTFGMPLTILDSEQMQPYECHEGNYGLQNMLEIARAADKKAAASQGAK